MKSQVHLASLTVVLLGKAIRNHLSPRPMRTSLHHPCCFLHLHLTFQNITFCPLRGHFPSLYTSQSSHWYNEFILSRSVIMDQVVHSVSLPLGLSMVLQSAAETSLFIFSVSPL